MVNWNKEVLHRCISQILFIDTEQLSKMQIYLQVFFKDFIDRFRTSYLENGFLWIYFSNILLIEFWLATNLKTYLPTYPPTYLPMYSFHNCVTIWVGIGKKEKGGETKGTSDLPRRTLCLIHSKKFLSPQIALYLFKSTTWTCMKYSCHF